MSNKYTPNTINDFVFYNDETELTIRSIINGKLPFPEQGTTGLLFFGPAGTGKTELAKQLPDYIEQAKGGTNALCEFYACGEGDDNGGKMIADIRSKLDKSPLSYSGLNFYVLDEVDNLTPKTLKALKGILNSKRSLFILTTNYPSKLDDVLKDRCLCLPFLQAPAHKWLPLARRIAADEGLLSIGDEELLQVCRESNGSARALWRKIALTANTVKSATTLYMGNSTRA